MDIDRERRLLQLIVALASLVPLAAGTIGVLGGFNSGAVPELDNHLRYLSGLLLGIGFYFLWSLPRIDLLARPYRLLTAIIFLGGLARLLGLALGDPANAGTLLPLAMELAICPLICLWQNSLARRHALLD